MNIERLKELEAKATPGPWEAGETYVTYMHPDGEEPIAIQIEPENVDFIAEMRNSLPKLLLRIEELETAGQAVLQQLHEALMEKGKLLAVVEAGNMLELRANRAAEYLKSSGHLSEAARLENALKVYAKAAAEL